MPYKFEQAAAILKIFRDDPAERRAKARAKKLVRAVRATHAGRPVAEVEAELRRRFAAQGITPQEPAFSEAVRAIAGEELL
jgi:hypothetical protein